MRFIRLRALAALAVLTGALAITASATAQPNEAEFFADYFDLNFSGGALADYVEAIRDASPSANIIVDKSAESLIVPEIRLISVDASAAAMLLHGTLTGPEDGVPIETRVEYVPIAGTERGVFWISADMHNVEQSRTSVWSVSNAITLGISAEALLSGIEVALEVTESQAVVRFHPDTALLIIRGTGEDIDVINMTLNSMADSARDTANLSRSSGIMLGELKLELVQAEGDLQIAMKEMQVHSDRLAWLNDASPDAGMSEWDKRAIMAEADLDVTRAEASVRYASERVDLIRQRIKSLEESAGG